MLSWLWGTSEVDVNLESHFSPGRDLNPEPLGQQSNMLCQLLFIKGAIKLHDTCIWVHTLKTLNTSSSYCFDYINLIEERPIDSLLLDDM